MTQTAEAVAVSGHDLPEKTVYRDWIETLLICVIFVIFSRAFVFQQSKIPSGSMMDTLLIGDYIMVNRFVYAPKSFDLESKIFPMRELRRGDVVVFKQPQEPEVDYIKRVIGLPGDKIEVRQGYLYRNGAAVDEPYVEDLYRWRLYPGQSDVESFGPITVKPGHYFMMGDHRNSSADSRAWGQVSRDLIKGRALLIWWSYNETLCRNCAHAREVHERGAGACQAVRDGTEVCSCRRYSSSPNNPYPGIGERLRSWGSKTLHFFGRSRWSRCFNVIR